MEIINITEEQREKLCNELARLILKFRENKSIKCVYFIPCKLPGSISDNVLEVTLVRDGEADDLNEKLKEYNSSHQEYSFIKEFGFEIFLVLDDAKKYSIIDLNPSEVRRSINLMNSTILYDESGEFTKIKEQATKAFKDNNGVYFYYDNLVEVFPPLEDVINKILENPKEFYIKIEDELSPQERNYLRALVENRGCFNCVNGCCRIEHYEKVGLDENGKPQGYGCYGWDNYELVGRQKVLS